MKRSLAQGDLFASVFLHTVFCQHSCIQSCWAQMIESHLPHGLFSFISKVQGRFLICSLKSIQTFFFFFNLSDGTQHPPAAPTRNLEVTLDAYSVSPHHWQALSVLLLNLSHICPPLSMTPHLFPGPSQQHLLRGPPQDLLTSLLPSELLHSFSTPGVCKFFL